VSESDIVKNEWIDFEVDSFDCMASAKILIQTQLLHFIEFQFELQIEEYQYKLFVRELEN
jgi:hypothetical protein